MLISFGTERFPFKRLCKYIERLLKEKVYTEKIIVQYGKTKCDNLQSLSKKYPNLNVFDFFPYTKFVEFIKKTDVVITHAGVGSFLDVINRGKIPIIVPRKPKLGEHLDDQQLQLAGMLKRLYNLPVAYTYKELKNYILKKDTLKANIKSYKKPLIRYLRDWVLEN